VNPARSPRSATRVRSCPPCAARNFASTIQISRNADASAFTAVDQRAKDVIEMPDPNRRYRVVSRQSLDYATVENRDNESFTGNLKISKPAQFWGASRFLVVVEQ